MCRLNPKSTCPRPYACRVSVRHNPFMAVIFLVALGPVLTQSGCVSSSGNLALNQSILRFGNVAIGSSSDQGLTLRNSGTAPFTITEVVASGRGFTIKRPSLPLSLAVGQSATLVATFAPSAIGESSGSLSLIEKTQESTPQLSRGSESATSSNTTEQRTVALAGTGVTVAPTITTQPTSDTILAGQSATFSVTSSGGDPLSYQWSRNGTAISGATSSTYTTPAATLADSGSQFTVKVDNSAGAVSSNAAILTVATARPAYRQHR